MVVTGGSVTIVVSAMVVTIGKLVVVDWAVVALIVVTGIVVGGSECPII